METRSIIGKRNVWIGCAMIWIVLYHAKFDVASKIFNFISSIGYGGVDVCIFASGIGCYYSLKGSSDACQFLKRRFLRLAPTYWCFLPFWIVFQKMTSEISLRGAFGNFLGLEYITNKGEAFNWYITLILMLYIIAPYLKQIIDQLDKKKETLLVLAFIIGSFAFWESKTYIIIFTRIPLFIMGMCLAKRCSNNCKISKKAFAFFSIVSIMGIISLKFVLEMFYEYLWSYGLYWYPFVIITPGLCMLVSLSFKYMERYKGVRWIEKIISIIAGYSFEIYLIHIPIFEYAHEIIEEFSLFHYKNLILLSCLGLTIVGCFLLRNISGLFLRVCKELKRLYV